MENSNDLLQECSIVLKVLLETIGILYGDRYENDVFKIAC